jgi:hypothetical protein
MSGKTFLLSVLCVGLLSICQAARADVVRSGNQWLVPVHLTKGDVVEGKSRIVGFVEGGQFEVLAKPKAIPVEASMCRESIILRMPWTDPDAAGAKAEIAEKKKLFDDFARLRAQEIDAVDAVVDVRPYGKVIGETPLKVELTQCNAFFVARGGHVLRLLKP